LTTRSSSPATLDKRQYLQEDVCWAAFRLFDRNGDGKISNDELKFVLETDEVEGVCGAQQMAEILASVDGNGDGVIDFQEFMTMMRGAAGGGGNELQTSG